jgi:hypothetical protein
VEKKEEDISLDMDETSSFPLASAGMFKWDIFVIFSSFIWREYDKQTNHRTEKLIDPGNIQDAFVIFKVFLEKE